jgi:hypothetical protein
MDSGWDKVISLENQAMHNKNMHLNLKNTKSHSKRSAFNRSFERSGCFLLACPSQTEALPTIPKNNSILELQGFLKHNDFASKSANKLKIAMLECFNLNKSIRSTKRTIVMKKNCNEKNCNGMKLLIRINNKSITTSYSN